MYDPVLRTINHERPQKQGGLYSLNLGQNNGPFLQKDKMTHQKTNGSISDVVRSSQSVLAKAGHMQVSSNQLIEPPEIYDDTLRQFTNYDERYKSKISASDNLISGSQLQEMVLKKLQEEVKDYKVQIEKLEEELKVMNEQINTDNINNIKELQPLLKEFNQRLKEQLSEEKNESYKLLREIEYLNREKLQIQQSILFCHKRIMELEQMVGVQRIGQKDFQEELAIEEEGDESPQEDEDDEQ